MKKTPYLKTKLHKTSKLVLIWTIFLFILMLCGCTKTAPEAATDAALGQVAVVEQQIKKECPQVKIDTQIDALRATIRSQLSSCNLQIEAIRTQRNFYAFGLFSVIALGLFILMRRIIRL